MAAIFWEFFDKMRLYLQDIEEYNLNSGTKSCNEICYSVKLKTSQTVGIISYYIHPYSQALINVTDQDVLHQLSRSSEHWGYDAECHAAL